MKKILVLLFAALSATSLQGQIKPKQTLTIKITGVPVSEQGRLNAAYPVSTDGYIDMWTVGRVKAAGLSSSQLAASIAAKFKAAEIYSSPVFQVINGDSLNEAAREKEREKDRLARVKDTKRYTVGGQVKGSGQQQWIEGTTLYGAIQSAGGETPYGAINRVKLYRNGMVHTYNLKDATHKRLKIYAGDLIEVPEKNMWGK